MSLGDQLESLITFTKTAAIEGDAWDIGKAVVYLSSKWAKYITGQNLVVDGGCSFSFRPRG